jgi:hypothetical protein
LKRLLICLVLASAGKAQTRVDLRSQGKGSLDAAAIGSGILSIGRLPTGTTGNSVALGNHLHTGVYQTPIAGAPAAWPSFAAVATSGAYADLLGRPVIPSISGAGLLKGSSGNAVSATYSDVAGLWSSCNGFLKSDGTCSVPSINWNGIGNPAGNLVLTMGHYTTGWTYDAVTGPSDLMAWTDTTNNTGTGILGHFYTQSGSSLIPWQADINGSGWRIATDGSLQSVGRATAGSLTLQRGTGGVALNLQGATAGQLSLSVPASFSNWTLTWPSAAAAAHQWLTTDSGGNASFTQPAYSDISGNLTNAQGPHNIHFVLDGGGTPLTTGFYYLGQIPGGCSIYGWSLAADQSGSISIDFDAVSNASQSTAPAIPSSSTNKISASAPMALASQQSNAAASAGVTTWTTGRSIWDSFAINITSAATVTRVVGEVVCQ